MIRLKRGGKKIQISYSDEWFDEEARQNTPIRIRRFLNDWISGKEMNFNFTMFDNPSYDELVVLKNIEFYSLCEHHLLPFYGYAHIGYLPSKKICGISKLSRVVDFYAHKPQLQEKLTNNVADFLFKNLEPLWLIVVIDAIHLCMRMRGIRKQNSVMLTSAVRGMRTAGGLKEEFFSLINMKGGSDEGVNSRQQRTVRDAETM